MELAKSITTAPMRLHGRQLADYAIERIDQGLLEADSIAQERTVGRAMMSGFMQAEEALEQLQMYEDARYRAFAQPTPTTEADLLLEGSPQVVVFDPAQLSIFE